MDPQTGRNAPALAEDPGAPDGGESPDSIASPGVSPIDSPAKDFLDGYVPI